MKKSLLITHPKVAKLWHTIKNGNLTPDDVTYGSNKKVWWICLKNDKHDYLNSVHNQTNGFRCSYCSGNKVNETNSLATLFPKFAKQWNYEKNIGLTPNDFTGKSGKKVWWRCPVADDHQWPQSIVDRTNRDGQCPMCLNRRIVKSNCMATTHPELAKEWAQELNGNVTPENIVAGVNNKYNWRCSKDNRHVWLAVVNSRAYDGKGCPICAGQKVDKTNSLATTNPELLKWWDYQKNTISPNEVTAGAKVKRYWKCPVADDHRWPAPPQALKRGDRCPFCAGQRIAASNSFGVNFPELVNELHPALNNNLNPLKTYMYSRTSAWWKCPKGDDHVWKAVIRERTGDDKTGCPICANKIIVQSNCMKTTHPDLAKEWAYDLNGKHTPENIAAGSNSPFHWRCQHDPEHTWKTTPNRRIYSNSGCPFCSLTPQSKQELTISFELKYVFDNIDPRGFKTKIENKILSIDIYIPDLNLGIEFDGEHWHKDKADFDKLKSKRIRSAGFNIMRVREWLCRIC